MRAEPNRRYIRQMILPEWGEAGQARLTQSKVLVVGAGGLGSPCLLYLAAAGIGTLGVLDHDRVDLSNLQRQILFETGDVGRMKAESAADALRDLNPEITLNVACVELTAENAERLIAPYDIVVDGSDNIATRFTVQDMCVALNKPLVSAAVIGLEGQISTFKGRPCYRCLYPEPPPEGTMPNCAENGILGALTGVMGSLQAAEVIKEIVGVGASLAGVLLRVNLAAMEFRRVVLKPDPECPLCANRK